MQVDHRDPGKPHEEDRRQDVIEAREDHQLRADAGDRGRHCRVRRRTIGVAPQREHRARDTSQGGALQCGDTCVIRDDDRDARVELAGRARIEDRLQV